MTQDYVDVDNSSCERLGTGESKAPSLLNLPAELRNAVYHYVLGGHEYHVYAHEPSSWFPNEAINAEFITTKIYLYNCTVHSHNPKLEWLDEHLSCFVDGHTGLPNTSFLQVSKQIYHEAGLIPYAANTFIFIAPPSFERLLLDTLTLKQAQALRHLVLWSPIGSLPIMDDVVAWKKWSLPPQIGQRNLLGGLRRQPPVFRPERDLDDLRPLDQRLGHGDFECHRPCVGYGDGGAYQSWSVYRDRVYVEHLRCGCGVLDGVVSGALSAS